MTHEHLDHLSHELLRRPYAELNDVQKRVIDLVLAEQPSEPGTEDEDSTFWTRLADRVAAVGGSWAFIGGFGLALFLWMGLNLVLTPLKHAFDPYPFIFLNLLLSTLAAIQAPVIMMSQNRQESRDRKRAENDYKINLKAELEIRHLHDKMDYMLHQQATRLMEVQQIQIELLREMSSGRQGPAKS